jgi:predicted hydrocarbon binding protein
MQNKNDNNSQAERMATNMTVRAHVDALREILGENGGKMIFRNIGHPDVFKNPPGFDWEPCMTEDDRTQIYTEVVNTYGLRGALSLWRRMGYTAVKYGAEIGHVMDSYNGLPPDEKFRKAMELLCAVSGKGKIVVTDEGKVEYDCFNCTTCAPYNTERPICFGYVGSLQYLADWAYGKGAYIVRETRCKAKGDDTCYHVLTENK